MQVLVEVAGRRLLVNVVCHVEKVEVYLYILSLKIAYLIFHLPIEQNNFQNYRLFWGVFGTIFASLRTIHSRIITKDFIETFISFSQEIHAIQCFQYIASVDRIINLKHLLWI